MRFRLRPSQHYLFFIVESLGEGKMKDKMEAGELMLMKGKLLTTLSSVGKEFFVAFELMVTKHTPGDWRSVIHLTTKGNYGAYGYRIPGVWLYKNHKLHIASAVSGNHNYYYDHQDPLKEGEWYHIAIMQVMESNQVFPSKKYNNFITTFQYIFTVIINGKQVHKVINSHPQSFDNVMVYAADPWYPNVNGKLRNLQISERIQNDETLPLKKSNLLKTLPSIGMEYFVSFDLMITEHTTVPWRNVLHLTTHGNIGVYGYRTPGVWLDHTHKLHIASAVRGNQNYYLYHLDPMKEGKWCHIVIMQVMKNGQVTLYSSIK